MRGLLGGRLKGRVATFTLVDHYDSKTDMSAMMRTTAFPASIVLQMLASGAIAKRGGILQERDVPPTCFWVKWKNAGSGFNTRSNNVLVWYQSSVINQQSKGNGTDDGGTS